MTQFKRSEPPPPAHQCPVCRHPQIKLQRRLTANTNGSTIYVCSRWEECSVGVNLTKVDTWVVV
jgi:ssDNA-binding Zn-finger/Zn-ribbon topoisomerase 1